MIEFLRVDCPYCGERFESAFDLSSGDTRLIEDCAVCCRPIVLDLVVDDGVPSVRGRRENE